MFKSIFCFFKGHDWEDIPEECLKEEYNLSFTGGRFCVCCKKLEIVEKEIPKAVDELKEKRTNMVKDKLREYMGLNGGYTSGGNIISGVPAPWDAPPPRF